MSTSAIVNIANGPAILCTLYVHYDGYPSGLGANIKRIYDQFWEQSRDMYCFAATLISQLKDGPGNVYMYAVGAHNIGESYQYDIWANKNDNSVGYMRCRKYDDAENLVTLFKGPISRFAGIDLNNV